jgi:hypothetical protein
VNIRQVPQTGQNIDDAGQHASLGLEFVPAVHHVVDDRVEEALQLTVLWVDSVQPQHFPAGPEFGAPVKTPRVDELTTGHLPERIRVHDTDDTAGFDESLIDVPQDQHGSESARQAPIVMSVFRQQIAR